MSTKQQNFYILKQKKPNHGHKKNKRCSFKLLGNNLFNLVNKANRTVGIKLGVVCIGILRDFTLEQENNVARDG